MKNRLTSIWLTSLLMLSFMLSLTGISFGQDYSKWMTIQVTTQLATSPPSITLNWPNRSADFTKYSLQRKAVGTSTFYTTLPATATGYVDTNVVTGIVYDYKIYATSVNTAYPSAYASVTTSLQLPATHSNGTLLIVVASDVSAGISTDLMTFRSNLRGEGWNIAQILVNPTDTVISVKNSILNQVATAAVPVKSLLLVGHVPVPYSGNINPDGHPEHKGAWPCDGYYGDIQNDVWTDTTINVTQATSLRNHNIPGDGKFDQSTFPGTVELSVGRVDFSDLTAFIGKTHVQLLKGYFQKNNLYRTGGTNLAKRAVIDDNLSFLKEGPSSALRRAANALYGNAGAVDGDLTTNVSPSVFGGGYGYGEFNNIDGVGSTNDFATKPMNTVFNLLFGSYFGDWDTTNNALRGSIAGTGVSLASIWSSRPVCHVHPMGVGKTIGDCVQTMMNQTSDSYLQLGFTPRSVAIALMGDPSLRLNPISPVRNLYGVLAGSTASITWTASTDTTARSYYVYRLNAGESTPVLLTPTPTTGTSFVDSSAISTTRYMVAAAKMELSSGSYWNKSVGLETGLMMAADPLAAWKTAVFGTSASNTAVSGDNADPDRDGCTNLMEYATGTDPMSSRSTSAMTNAKLTGIGSARVLTAEFRVCTANSGVTVSYQCTSNLKTWAGTTTPTVVATTATHTTYRVSVPAPNAKCFLRAVIQRN